jgi:N-acetylmuramoyl-L-alanine amidase
VTNAFKSDDSSLSISLPGTRSKGMTFPKKVRTPYRKLFLLSLIWTAIFILLIPAASSVAGAVSSPVHTEVQVNLLNLRTGPSTVYTRIQGLPFGTPLEVLFQEKEWLLVRLKDGTTGWVDGKYTGFTSNLADKLPPVIGEKATVTVNLLNVRLGADLNYQRINQLHLYDTVTVYFHEGDWVLIRLGDETSGWVYREYTSFTPQAAGTEPQIPDINAASETPPSAPHQQLTSAEEEEQYPYHVIVTSTPLRLREQPQLNSTPLGELTKDMVLIVLDKTKEDWLQVELPDGRQGWVAGWCTQKLEEDNKNSEKKGTDPLIRLAAVTADILRVRSGPGLDYTQIGRVFCGNHLLIQQEQNGWYYVRTPTGQYGWVSSEYTTPVNIVSRGNSSAKAYDVTQYQNITVVIDPGHGGQDKGATGISGLKEKNVNLTVALYLEELLRARGFNVVMTRKNDTSLTLAERAALAEKAKADLFISIHANASLYNKYASGTETYYYQNKKTSPQSLYLASLIQQEVSAALKLPSLGVKKAPFHVLRETSMPAALVELAFLSNAVDETILASDHCLKLAAEALYRAVLRYYNLNQ